MNYPFTKQMTLRRFLSLALVLALTLATLSGCSLLPSSDNNTVPSEEETSTVPVIETEPPTEAPTTPPTQAPTEKSKENVAIVKEQMSLRQNPSTGSRVYGQLDAGDELSVTRIDPIGTVNWAFVYSPTLDKVGWVTTDMLDMSNVTVTPGDVSTPGSNTTSTTPTSSVTVTEPTSTNVTAPTVDSITGIGGNTTTTGSGKYGVVTASELNIRKTASSTADRVGSYTHGNRISILETSNGWGRTDKGWVSLDYVYVEGEVGNNSAYGTITATQLNVRSGPGTNYDRIKSLEQGARVQIMQRITIGTDTWGYTNGGWVSMEYVNLDGSTTNTGNTGTTGGTTVVGVGSGVITGSAVNIRAGAGTSYQIVGGKSMGDVVNILETVSAEGKIWGRIDLGWICMDYVRMN